MAAGLPTWATLLVAITGIALLSIIDYRTGSEFAFSLFYLGPILYATWYAGRRQGALVAVVAAVTWGIVDVAAGAHYSVPIFAWWNSLMRLGFFVLALWLLSEVQNAQGDLVRLANTDGLTALANARSFYAAIERESERHTRYGHPFTVAYVDLDNFKVVNDTLGHAAGDELLRRVAETITETMRDSDSVARLGGDEFGILMPETGEATAATALERVRKALIDEVATSAEDIARVDATIGAVVFLEAPESADAAVRLTDALMYEGKRAGRSRMRLAVQRSGVLYTQGDAASADAEAELAAGQG